MSLANGKYLIQFASGSVYATRDGLNSPILASPLSSTDDSSQVWAVQAVAGSSNTYTISQPTDPNVHIGPVIGGFSLESGSNDVYLRSTILNWVLNQVDASNSIYIIAEPGSTVGSTTVVNVDSGNLAVETIAVGNNKDGVPQWKFTSVNDLD